MDVRQKNGYKLGDLKTKRVSYQKKKSQRVRVIELKTGLNQ